MRARRTLLPVMTVGALLLSGCGGTDTPTAASEKRPYVPYHFSYIQYDSVAEANDASNLIVEGTVTSSQATTPEQGTNPETGVKKTETLEPGEAPYVATVYNFNVTAVRKAGTTGVKAGQSIKFTQAGGTYEGVDYGTEEMASLPPSNIKHVLLLVGSAGKYTLLNPSQGAYNQASTPNGAVEANQPADTPDDVAVASNSSELG